MQNGQSVFLASLPSLALFSASFQTFCLTARADLNTQKYGLFCSLFLRCISSEHSSGSDAYHCSRAVCRGRCDSSLGSPSRSSSLYCILRQRSGGHSHKLWHHARPFHATLFAPALVYCFLTRLRGSRIVCSRRPQLLT